MIIPATVPVRQATSTLATIGTVSDDKSPAGDLIVEVVTTTTGVFLDAVVNIDGTITASLFANCPAAVGQNLVGLKVTDSDGESSTANLIIEVTAENVPPTIQCRSGILAVTARPGEASVLINYDPPQASDNCSQPSVVCNPPSGSAFPVGVTTVTCTATDAAGNTAECSFTVRVFDACLQDDANTNAVLLFNTFTGDYFFCFNGTLRSGQGSVTRKGNTFMLVHNTSDRRVQATLDASQNRGTASLQSPPGSAAITITDRDIRNNACNCFLI